MTRLLALLNSYNLILLHLYKYLCISTNRLYKLNFLILKHSESNILKTILKVHVL